MSASARFLRVDAARQWAGMSVEQLWVEALGLGSFTTLFEVDAYLHGLLALDDREQDVLAIVINERLEELFSQHRVPHRMLGRLEPSLERAVAHLLGTGLAR